MGRITADAVGAFGATAPRAFVRLKRAARSPKSVTRIRGVGDELVVFKDRAAGSAVDSIPTWIQKVGITPMLRPRGACYHASRPLNRGCRITRESALVTRTMGPREVDRYAPAPPRLFSLRRTPRERSASNRGFARMHV